jgi:hypothetical protein
MLNWGPACILLDLLKGRFFSRQVALKSIVPVLVVSAVLGNLLEIQMLGFCPRPTESETLGVELSNVIQ